MKNKIVSLLFLAIAVANMGCNKKFLEEMKSYTKYDENIFTNEVQTGWYIDKLYKDYFGAYKNPTLTLVGNYNGDRHNRTEEVGGVTDYTNPNKTLVQATQADSYYGAILSGSINNNAYTRIRTANLLLDRINGIGSVLSEDFKKTARGQMYMFRALQYFDLVRVYGGVPIILTVQNASATDESIKVPRAKSSEVFDQVVTDLDSAIALLPFAWASSNDFGRFTSAAALAIKSRVLVTAASPLYNANWDNSGDQHWQRALDASLQAEDKLTHGSVIYGSAITNAKDWADVTYKADNQFNGEGVFVILLSNTTTTSLGNNSNWENTVRLPDNKGGTGISVPKGMLDLFPLADGSRPVIGTNYNDTFFFENRDPRFYRTFAFSGEKWPIKQNANKTSWMYRWKKVDNTPVYYTNNTLSSPAVVRKMSNPNADSTSLVYSGTDIFDFRFGELLLNIAECYAAKGDIANCLIYLEKIRSRVGIPAANNYGIGVLGDKYAALEACLYERRVELAYEGKRYWDCQRWMLYDDDASIGDNTNSKLHIPIINGTNHTGYYWQAKSGNADPLTASDRNILIDPDNTGTFAAQIQALKALYNAKFVMTPLDKPMDLDGSVPVNILFRSNYYLSGIKQDILANNPWLLQTSGWQDYNGAMGTFDYRQ